MAGSGQRAHGVKSDGMRIDDHANWTGKAKAGQVYADGAKMKAISDQEGAGSVMRYEDTEERIAHVQDESAKQLRNRPLKPGYRN